MKSRIYLDNNSTTEIDEEVAKAIHKENLSGPANPSSPHYFGQKAKARLSFCRKKIADIFHVLPQEILFTSSGTEGINFVLRGCLQSQNKAHIISSSIEHACVFETLKQLEKTGSIEVTFLSPNSKGQIDFSQVEKALKPETKYIALASVNSETGVHAPIERIAELAYKKDLFFVVDAVAQFGKEPIKIFDGISAMCFSAHKFHGPKGVGCMFLRTGFSPSPLLTGGSQEFQKRAGTENLSGIVGMTKAMEKAVSFLLSSQNRIQDLRDDFEKILVQNLENISINGTGERICNTSNICFEGVDGETLLILLDQEKVAASLGSSCSAGAIEPSRVLLNMGLDYRKAKSSIRFSLSRKTTKQDIETACKKIIQIVQKLRKM